MGNVGLLVLALAMGCVSSVPLPSGAPSPTRPPVPPSTEPKAPSEQSALAKNLLTHPEPENPGIRPSTPTPLPTLRPSMASHANHHNRGMYYFRRNMYQQAIDEFTMSIRLDSRFPDNFKVRGLAYAELGQYERAVQDYDKVIQIKPNYARAYNNRGAAYSGLGQYQRAIPGVRQGDTAIPGICRRLQQSWCCLPQAGPRYESRR